MMDELEETHEALSVNLYDDSTFQYVVTKVFRTIDSDVSGQLGRKELRAFIQRVCLGMGMKTVPEDKSIDEVFRTSTRTKAKTSITNNSAGSSADYSSTRRRSAIRPCIQSD
jgi:hypothetical protein